MDFVEIKGYKSIRDAKIELKPINIMIGANGSGKSNFISFFEFLNRLYNQNIKEYIALKGGADKILHKGIKFTDSISALISFNNGTNAYSFTLENGDDDFIFTKEALWYNSRPWDIATYNSEANVKNEHSFRAAYVRDHLKSFKKYHFHDTGGSSPFSQMSHIENDGYFLYEKGENIAAFLFFIFNTNHVVYNRIVKTIQSIAPYFSDFFLQPNSQGYIRLQWQSKFALIIYGIFDF